MRKLLIVAAILFATTFLPQKVYAQNIVAQSSATLAGSFANTKPVIDMRTRAIENVFKKYNSPIAAQAKTFVKYADAYGVDWKLLPSISGLESSFGVYLIAGSHNAYGWGGGHIYFDSWEDGIRTINQALRQNYIDKGASDVWSIGRIYAESPTWAVRVNSFMRQIDEEYLRLTTFAVVPNI